MRNCFEEMGEGISEYAVSKSGNIEEGDTGRTIFWGAGVAWVGSEGIRVELGSANDWVLTEGS